MLYRKLRAALKERDFLMSDVAEELGVCSVAVSHRMSGRTPWKQDEMYKVMHLLDLPVNQLHVYFPEDGKDIDGFAPQHARTAPRELKANPPKPTSKSVDVELLQKLILAATEGGCV